MRRSLYLFATRAWHIVEPAVPLVEARHVQVICDYLQRMARGDIPRLVVNIPPGHGKSILSSVLLPAWIWTWRPQHRSIYGSYDLELSTRDSMRTRALVRSDWYQDHFVRGRWSISEDQDRAAVYSNTLSGSRMSVSVGSKGTGYRGDMLVIDDPVKAQDTHNRAAHETAIRWYRETLSTRFNVPSEARICVIGQRLHHDDLSGHLLRSGDGWAHLCLPSEYRASGACEGDWRTEEGELLFPEFFSAPVLASARRTLGGAYHGQHQQDPIAADATIFGRDRWQWWDSHRGIDRRPQGCSSLRPVELPQMTQQIISVDATFKETSAGSYVVIQVWGVAGSGRYLLDQSRARRGFVDTVAEIQRVAKVWPSARTKLIEDKANGPAIINSLSGRMPGVMAYTPRGSKEARAHAVSPFVDAGNVYLPAGAPWVSDWVDELERFPLAANDDQVDAMTQALEYLDGSALSRFAGMARL